MCSTEKEIDGINFLEGGSGQDYQSRLGEKRLYTVIGMIVGKGGSVLFEDLSVQ